MLKYNTKSYSKKKKRDNREDKTQSEEYLVHPKYSRKGGSKKQD